MKRVLTLFLIISLLVAVFSACQPTSQEEATAAQLQDSSDSSLDMSTQTGNEVSSELQETASSPEAVSQLPEGWSEKDLEVFENMFSMDYREPNNAWNSTEPNMEGINLHYDINWKEGIVKDIPCPIQPYETGFWPSIYISPEMTTVAYGGTIDYPDITILFSTDMGVIWKETKIQLEGQLWDGPAGGSLMDKLIHIDFVNQEVGYLFLARRMPNQDALYMIYKTTNSAVTWEKISELTNHDGEYHNIYFSNKDIGFMPGNEGDKKVLYRTLDGGYTWENIAPALNPLFLDAISGYYSYGYINIPYFDGNYGYLPVTYHRFEKDNGQTLYLYSKDYGKTWIFGHLGYINEPQLSQ